MVAQFAGAGYTLRTSPGRLDQALIEVYPHTAILALLSLTYRHPYKVGKRDKLGLPREQRIQQFLFAFNQLFSGLSAVLGPLGFDLPTTSDGFAHLKRYEDVLDAAVCAWVGVRALAGQSRAVGDERIRNMAMIRIVPTCEEVTFPSLNSKPNTQRSKPKT